MKLKLKKMSQLELVKFSFRRTWHIKGITQITPDRTKYDRKREKRVIWA